MANRSRILAAMILPLAGGLALGAADGRRDSRAGLDNVKAAFLLNFIRYTKWPVSSFEEADSPFRVGVLSAPPLARTLTRTLTRRSVRGRSIRIQEFALPAPDDDDADTATTAMYAQINRCHVVYLGEPVREQAAQVISRLNSGRTVIVGGVGNSAEDEDVPLFAHSGAMLSFGLDDNKLIFYANLQALRHSTVKVSSQVLKLARIVNATEK